MTWLHDRTILVVDDDTDVLLALRKRLHDAGVDVLTASNGSEALELARQTTIDAITLDVSMPGGMNGMDVASALQHDPQTARVPIIFITGTADARFREKCEAVGAKYFLSKPYDAELLVQTLASIFGEDELAEIRKIAKAKRRQPVK
ncbi:MAG: response regulator [Phycisphaerae bacterium]|jgi:chemosensory pili system protein ChpA (sensor histidine kinase/response regulator)